ncbi:spirocyclase AveC family protein [Nocardia sp. R16R-3T]
MATHTPPASRLARSRSEADVETKKVEPVVWWAIAGALTLALIAYILLRWITGPYFKAVDPGPTQVTDWQHYSLLVIQIGGSVAAVWCLWHFLVKPWRRDGKPTSEGLLAAAYATLYIQDPVSLSGGYWFTYNATMFNRGSWAPYLPFFNAPSGEPGNMLAEPIIGMGPGYVYFWLIGVGVAFWVLKTTMKRFPRFGVVGGLLAAYVACVVFDVVIEGFIWMKTGFYAYPGAPGPKLFKGSFTAYPFVEGILIGFLLTPYALLRYYKDDKGYTIVERGVDNLRVGKNVKVLLRFLALVAVAQAIYFFCYNIYAYHVGVNQTEWPKAVQERSYFLNGVCGEGTGRDCYAPSIPNARKHSAYIGSDGKLVVPSDVGQLPQSYPVLHGKH